MINQTIHFKHTVSKEQENEKLENFLSKMEKIDLSQSKKMIESNLIYINGLMETNPNTQLNFNDEVAMITIDFNHVENYENDNNNSLTDNIDNTKNIFLNYFSVYGTMLTNFPNDPDCISNLGWIGEDYPEYIDEVLHVFFAEPLSVVILEKITCLTNPKSMLSVSQEGVLTKASVSFDLDVILIDSNKEKWKINLQFNCFGILNEDRYYDLKPEIIISKKEKI